jgi:hypothetical protein
VPTGDCAGALNMLVIGRPVGYHTVCCRSLRMHHRRLQQAQAWPITVACSKRAARRARRRVLRRYACGALR